MTKPTREQTTLYNHFLRLVEDEHFLTDLQLLRDSDTDIRKPTYKYLEEFDDGVINAEEIPSPLHQMMMKHKLPVAMENFLRHYIAHDEIALDKLRNGIYLVDNETMEASGNLSDKHLNYQAYVEDTTQARYIEVTLAVPVHATNVQIRDTIAQHQQFIKDRQTEANGGERIKRVKLSPKAFRNQEIMRLSERGYKASEIVWELPESLRGTLTGSDISKILHKLKSKQ